FLIQVGILLPHLNFRTANAWLTWRWTLTLRKADKTKFILYLIAFTECVGDLHQVSQVKI
ncbi:hypothetical protein, partial [Clostridium arbusti]|uniref:hypothetical protein n=1 Tax=Clostridium arbusti TaxID=1137848 RepID=UPI00055C73CD